MDAETAHRFGRQIALALLDGSAERAHAIIDEALGRAADDPREMTVGQRLDLHLIHLAGDDEHKLKIAYTLNRYGIDTVGQLFACPPSTVMDIKGMGPRMLELLNEMVARAGLQRTYYKLSIPSASTTKKPIRNKAQFRASIANQKPRPA